jgi:aspartyl-tRNA(Asn)/glutamyl-tRNA(Gln) amidotransferase subunit A
MDRVRELDNRYCFMNAYAEEEPYGEGLLRGYAVSVKDNVCVNGVESKAGSMILEGYVPPFDATVVAKSRAEGAFIIGKTTQDEFGFGTFNVNTPYKIPLNPYDPGRSTGGSSGGAACLTAVADFPHVAISESTGGSISCPASWCGVVGITPTYGRVSRWGLIDYANSLDKIGVMAKTVKEAAMFLGVISGQDEYDSTVLKAPVPDYMRIGPFEDMRIGVPKEYLGEGVDSKVEEQVWDSLTKLESMGASISEVSLPHTKYSLSSYYIIAMAEASTNLAKFSGLRYGLQKTIEGDFNQYFSSVRTEGMGDEAKRRVMLGTFTRMAGYRDAYYLKALKVRTRVIEDFKKAFKTVNVLAAPTMPVVAPRFHEIAELEPIQHYMMDILTVAPNLAGVPMVTVPCGEADGMPVGLHLMADHLNEVKALEAAQGVEQG